MAKESAFVLLKGTNGDGFLFKGTQEEANKAWAALMDQGIFIVPMGAEKVDVLQSNIEGEIPLEAFDSSMFWLDRDASRTDAEQILKSFSGGE